jgi:hypothetical protein
MTVATTPNPSICSTPLAAVKSSCLGRLIAHRADGRNAAHRGAYDIAMLELGELPQLNIAELLESAQKQLARAQVAEAQSALLVSARGELNSMIAEYADAGAAASDSLSERLRTLSRRLNALSSSEAQGAMLALMAAADMMRTADSG